MKVYFARPISQYGNKQDERDLELITRMFSDYTDPNTPEFQRRYDIEGMDVFVNAVKDCEALVFRSFVDGKIPAGVMKEIETAIIHGKLILELPTITPGRVLNVEDSRKYLSLLGYR